MTDPSPGPKGLYVHLPFCASRCAYCTFVVSTERRLVGAYVEAIHRELELLDLPEGTPLETVYLGGGTPSLIGGGELAGLLRAILERHPGVPGIEVTTEANPEDLTPELLGLWTAAGINRISIGVQSFVDGELTAIGRRHDAARARAACHLLARVPSVTWNLDLILGIPGQTPESLEVSLAGALEAAPHHISVYILEMDKPHRLQELYRRHPDEFPGDDTVAGLYLRVHEVLGKAGYEHYEISNFALPGAEARHNLRYWDRRPVHALGVGAHGNDGNRRWANLESLAGYLEAIRGGERPLAWETTLSPREMLAEGLMLGLRLAAGVDRGSADAGGASFPEFGRMLEGFLQRDLAVEDAGRIFLTPEGWLLSNELFATLV